MSVQATITITSALALFTAMAVLAAMPSSSVLAVSARSASAGFRHGAFTAAGIVLGDLVFILLAVFGLALLVEALGDAFVLVRYAGGAYLLWLAVLMWRTRKQHVHRGNADAASSTSSFMTGLLITLGDQKAVLFYLGFLPAFMDLSALTLADIAVIVAITVVAVGGVKLAYAGLADRGARVLGSGLSEKLNVLAAGVMCAAGLWLIANT